jgi:hypothetical protein
VNGKLNQPPRPVAMKPQNPASAQRVPVSLHIERLVLDGLSVAGAERGQLHDAVVAELETLFTKGLLSPELRPAALQSLRLDDIRLQRGAAAEQIGVQIARALHGGIGS